MSTTTDRPSEPGDDGDDDQKVAPPVMSGPRMANIPGEQSRDFGHAVRRTFARLRHERIHVWGVVVLAVVAVSLQVVGPRILGHATDIIVEGFVPALQGRQARVDTDALRNTLLTAVGLYAVSATLSWLQSYILAGVVQRTMYRLLTLGFIECCLGERECR